jgi:hypothetical protein
LDLDVRESDAGVTVRVRVQPRAAREGIVGQRGDALCVRVCAPASEGAANAALQRVLADALGVAVSRVSLLRGAAAREKILHIAGVDVAHVLALLG